MRSERNRTTARAQVNTKWNDYYGESDSKLRFKLHPLAALPKLESFTLIRVPDERPARDSTGAGQSNWKIEGPLRSRAASTPAAIRYLEKMRGETTAPVLRNNAGKSIVALKRLRSGCGIPNPC